MDMNKSEKHQHNIASFFSFKPWVFPSLCLTGLLLFSHSSIAKEQPLDHIAAIVNSDIVMLSSVLQQAKRLKSSVPEASKNERMKQALEQLILVKVQVQHGKQLGIIVDDVMLNRSIENIARQNKLSLADFKTALERSGFEYGAFREEIRNRLMIDARKQRQSGQRSNISEQEVTDLIFSQATRLNKDARYLLQDILIPAPNGSSLVQFNQARSKALTLRNQLLKQKIFEAKGFTTTKIIWKGAAELPIAYTRALSLMSINEISPVIHDSNGFHILKLVEKQGGGQNLQLQAHSRHILIGDNSNKGLQKANKLRQQLQAGADFATLAKINSADTSSAINGGDLGWATPTTYVPAFANIVKTSPINTISQPVKTKFGWHIIEVIERKKIDASRKALRASAKSLLSKKKGKNGYKTWLKDIRDDAFVEYRLAL
jgi:peptidyl-prolyl cis-trans isomerase SurA